MKTTTNLDPNSRLSAADALRHSGNHVEAEAMYRQLLSEYPGQAALLQRLAITLRSQERFKESEQLYRQAIFLSPKEPSLHNSLGNLMWSLNRLSEAESCFCAAIEINPGFAEAWYNLGVALEAQNKNDDAYEQYAKAVSLQPHYRQALTRLAAILHSRGAFAEALTKLDMVAASEQNSFDTLYYRGLTLAGLEQFSDAIEALSQACSLRKDSIEAQCALANNMSALDRNEEALIALWSAMELKPQVVETHNQLNQLAWMADRKDIFLRSFAFARERIGENPLLLFSEAQMRIQTGDTATALSVLHVARDLAPDNAGINALLGRLASQRGDFAASYEFFSHAVRMEPNAAACHNEFGFALLLGKEPRNALHQFGKAIQINPIDQTALAGTCLALRALGDSYYHKLVNTDFVRSYRLKPPIGYADARLFNAALAEELQKLHTMKTEPLEQTLRTGTQTSGSLFRRKLKMVELLREQIRTIVSEYIASMARRESHPFLSRIRDEFTFSHSWSSKLRSGGFHTNHVHPMGWISSAYYVHLPEETKSSAERQGWLKFGESHLDLGNGDSPEYFVQPQVGQLVLFPSYFWHGTVPFSSASERLTVAFDVIPGNTLPG